MIREITAKTLLQTVRPPDPWFGLKYNFNLYRGCQHQCIYCDSRSECYQIEDFNHDVLVKANAIELLQKELARKRVVGTIGTGSMNDPYMPLEARLGLTRQALQVIAAARFPVHIITKSDLVLRDLPLLKQINAVYAAVSLSITTAQDDLSRKLEPGAPPSSARFKALEVLAANGIPCGVTMMPLLPWLEDSPENMEAIIQHAAACGARYVLPGFGLTLRDRQRAYFYARLDQLFPGLRQKYEQRYGERYSAESPRAPALRRAFGELLQKYNIAGEMPKYAPPQAKQMSIFEV